MRTLTLRSHFGSRDILVTSRAALDLSRSELCKTHVHSFPDIIFAEMPDPGFLEIQPTTCLVSGVQGPGDMSEPLASTMLP